jgi:UDP-N-acetylmuramoyl-tripeptide--D-alanyl-D-alanine ligase
MFAKGIEWIAQISPGRLFQFDPSKKISKFSIDTRTLNPGDFFIALPGSQTDGHHFLESAFEKGASGALVQKLDSASIPKSWFNLVLVNDTLQVLHNLARAYRSEFQIPIIAVTGSSGKTTTKELIAHLLNQRFRAYKSPGNHNSEYGLPLAILDMPINSEAAVFELGLQKPNDIKLLANLLNPTIGVITMIGEAHLEFFQSIEKIAAEKWQLIEALPISDGLAVLNADSPHLRERTFSGRNLWFGAACPDAQIRVICQDAMRLHGLSLVLQTPKGKFDVTTRLLGNHNSLNIAAAWAVAAQVGLSSKTIQAALGSFPGVPHRMQLKKSKLGWILDDSYNANPSAVKEAIQTLSKLHVPDHKKIFVFGDMRELGTFSRQAHIEIAAKIADAKIDQAFLIGGETKHTADYLLRQPDWPSTRVTQTRTTDELLKKITTQLSGSENVILVKGSRANELDLLVDQLVQLI